MTEVSDPSVTVAPRGALTPPTDAATVVSAPAEARTPRWGSRHSLDLVLVVVAVGAVVYVVSNDNLYTYLIGIAAIYALVSVGNNLLLGHAGSVSLCQGALFAVGAYGTGLPLHHGVAMVPSMLIGIIEATVVSVVLALPAIRLRGHYFALLTLAFNGVVAEMIVITPDLTGGETGLSLGQGLLSGQTATILAIVLALGAVVLQNIAIRGRLGLALHLARDSEKAARASGLNVARLRLLSFGYAGLLAGIGGCLYPSMAGYLSPDTFDIWLSVYFLVAVVIGGLRSAAGAVLGAALVVAVPRLLTGYRGLSPIIFGLALLAVLIASNRLIPLIERRRAR